MARTTTQKKLYRDYIKRLLDIVFALTLLIIALPIALIIAIFIKLDSKGPVIFRHKRCGRYSKPFVFYKFRSMHTHAPSEMPTREASEKSHITRVGRILRKLSLDEIPQLWNVLRGDMSVIGPRPVVCSETSLIRRRAKNGADQLRPGITGWAQVCGRDLLGPAKKARLDAEYAARVSFGFDIYCLVMTIWAVVTMHGHSEGSSDDHKVDTDKTSSSKK